MASKIKYSLCLVVISLMAAIHVRAQYSEQDLIEEANALFDKGEFAEAMPLYSQLLSLNPTNPVFNYKYGATALYGDAEKKEEAIKYLKFSVGKPNVDDQSWYYLGRAYHLNYLFQDAISAYEKYKTLASNSDLEEKEVGLKISMAKSGQNLLSQIKEIKVLDKKQSSVESFFRIYDLSDIGGKILVTPEELLSSEDKKRNHRSLIHFRGAGTTIYFSSYGKSGKNGLDIYHADVLPDGSYTDPVAVQGSINTPYDEDFPYLHPDDKTFYFSSKGHGSMGGYDVYKSGFSKASGVFSTPVNLDFAVNTPDDDLFYLADSLNEMAYFASARSSKQGQLDVYKVLVKSAPIDITLIKGTFINQIDPSKKLAKITTIDATTNKEVDIQYTDPTTGEYVLSFPKGGKYKFLVEEKSSDKIHAGLVDVPSSAGVNAYLQEMELISSVGVEKLMINNLFDQTYDGDVMALAQKMLRQRAALDVNFDPNAEPTVTDTPDVEKDPALAYSDAGFGAGMTNETILEQAEARVEELKDRQLLTAQLAEGAARSSDAYFTNAQDKGNKAESLVTEANSASSENRNSSMYSAAFAKLEAETALRKATNSKSLKDELYQKATVAKEEYEAEKARVDSLREAIDSNDYDGIYAGLVAEREKRESIDQIEDRFDPVQDIRRSGLKSNSEAQKLLEKAQSLRDQEEQLNATLITRRTQSTKMKGKDLKQVEEEITVLESDIESAKRRTERAFKQAEDAQILADNEIQEFEILKEIADSNDPTLVPEESEPVVSWSDPEQKLLAESLRDLPIDNAAIAAYTSEHPEVFDQMDSEAMAMNFRRTYGAGNETTDDVAMIASKQGESESLIADNSQTDSNQPEQEVASSETPSDSKSNDISQNPDSETNTIMEGAVGAAAVVGTGLLGGENSTEEAEVEESEDLAIEYDESLPVEKRIEAEELKIQAAEDWVAIIDESIEQLESGVGGEEDVEEQLADYRKLRDQKASEIGQRQELISAWENEISDVPTAEALARAGADLDTLSPSFVARLESKIPDYSTEIKSIRSVSAINRNYLPTLAEIEISGLSAPEMAEKRIELNEGFIADIDQILNEGIDSEVSEEDLVEMRRVKMLELRQDEEVMEGKAVFVPRSEEAKSYAELIKQEEDIEEIPNEIESESEYTELSPAMAQSLQNDYSRESVLPDYSALLEEAELTTNPQIAQAQRVKVKEDFLIRLQSEISIYKAAVDAAESPDPQLVERYTELLRERSDMIDEVNSDKATLMAFESDEIADEEIQISADSLITVLRVSAISIDNETDQAPTQFEIDEANELVSDQIDEYVAILDDPQAKVNRDAVQVEIQKLQAFQTELSASAQDQILAENRSTQELTAEKSPVELEEDMAEESDETPVSELTETGLETSANVPVGEALTAVGGDDKESSEIAQSTDETETPITEAQRKEFEDILSISEGFVIDFDQKATVVIKDTDVEERELIALARLNDAFVESIENKVDSLESIKYEGDEEFQNVIDEEILELQALSADKQQESDRLMAEAELMEMAQTKAPAIAEESNTLVEDFDERISEIKTPDLSTIQYKSLNASMIRNGLKSKSDSLNQLKREYADLTTEAERSASLADIERINTELTEGINQSNFAEIEFYRNENERIISHLDPNASANREEMIALQAKATELNSKVTELELGDNTDEQMQLIAELAEVNTSLGSFTQADTETDDSVILEDMTSALLLPESHETLPNKAYLTEMQSVMVSNMTEERREELMTQDEILKVNLDFSETNSVDVKKELIAGNTKVDAIGLNLLAESPDQLDYLVAMVRADSLKSLERNSAAYAEMKQNQAIERSAEADRLLKMLPNQETDRDRESVKARAKKLEQEAEVLYEKSAVAAQQAEMARAKRSDNDQELIALSTDLSFKQRRALDDLLLKPGYRIIPSEESAEELAEGTSTRIVEETPRVEKEMPAEKTEVSKSSTSTNGLDALKGNWLGMVEIIAEKDDFSDVEGSMFAEAPVSVYSADKPIPVDPVMPDGLIFQVQVGAYRNPIPQDLFGPYAPIMGQKLDNGITRYRAGLFKKYNEAIQARNEIREKGYSDAFVVVYVNGEKLTGAEARDILAQAKAKETISVELVSGVPTDEPLVDISEIVEETPKLNTEYYNDPEAAEAAQVEVITGLFYTVQVGVYSKPVKLDQLFNLTELNSELTGSGVIRYTTGRFADLKEATSRKELAREKGVSDAFITAYYNGKRISLAEAERALATEGVGILADQASKTEVESIEPKNTAEKENDESYVVIMGTFASDVPQELADLFLENKSWGIRKIQGPGNGAIYLSEDIETLEDAKKLLEECRKLNIRSATIGKMKNGQITSVQID
ncbi:hypothetical protein O3Q51_05630 [Cryomorphaceae bacterium 1068]|nr:hypothetical protein [Cryomorphaceae bacterium 1068]